LFEIPAAMAAAVGGKMEMFHFATGVAGSLAPGRTHGRKALANRHLATRSPGFGLARILFSPKGYLPKGPAMSDPARPLMDVLYLNGIAVVLTGYLAAMLEEPQAADRPGDDLPPLADPYAGV
jgi:hypothetical protein